MSEYAVLGPVDRSWASTPPPRSSRSCEKTGREVDDQTLILADQAEKALSR